MNTVTRNDIIAAHPLDEVLRGYGRELTGNGREKVCCCLFHDDKHPSMRVNLEKQTWFCDVCGFGGSVIDLKARMDDVPPHEAYKVMAKELADREPSKPQPAAKSAPMHFVETYAYQDAYGQDVFYVDRLEDNNGRKRFRQWHKDENGERVNNLDGIERTLWRLPAVLNADEFLLVEGEKCVKACEEMGYTGTTNPGGSGGWLAGYANYLKGKHVVIVPDNDEPGKKWTKAVMDSLAGRVASLRLVCLPKKYNDIADLVEENGAKVACRMFDDFYEQNVAVERGVMLPIYSATELLAQYQEQLRLSGKRSVDLSKWLPSLAANVRVLVPGDVMLIIADTGVGKSAALQNIMLAQAPLPCLIFEIELSGPIMAERFVAISTRTAAWDVEKACRDGKTMDVAAWEHIWTCPQSHIKIEQIEEYIEQAELKMGVPPALICIDYIGLVQGGRGKRYERISEIAESIKVMAKATQTVVIMASQVKRKQSEEGEDVGLHDAKDSGSAENSSTVVLGLTRPQQGEMLVRVLKDTRGSSGIEVYCDYHGPSLVISERKERIWTGG